MRYIIRSHRLTDAEKDIIKELAVSDVQQNESVTFKINAVNNETNTT